MEYKLIYSDRKSISASVKGGVLTVRAPRGVKQKTIDDFLIRHSSWIEEHLALAKKKEERFSSLSESEISKIKKEAKAYLETWTDSMYEEKGIKGLCVYAGTKKAIKDFKS
jgi:predicted metal-dependent hydrolase